jgi:hypothetical protein
MHDQLNSICAPAQEPFPLDSDFRDYDETEDGDEATFLIEIEEIEDADDADYPDNGSARR